MDTIIYACETYYGLSKYHIRQIERIEENFLRKLFKASKGCPIAQLYLESGHIPARFQIYKSRLIFLKYILERDPKSLLYNFLNLQLKFPTRGDWASSCLQDLKYLEIELKIEEIEEIKRNQFVKIINESIEKNHFNIYNHLEEAKAKKYATKK